MAEREPHAVGVVGADVAARLPAADVDPDQRYVARGEVGDQRVVVVHADQDGGVEAMLRSTSNG